MTKAEQKPALTPAKVLACMAPGTTYTVSQVARLLGTRPPEAQRLLSGCVVRGKVKEAREDRRRVYRVPTEDELRRERDRVTRSALSQGTLQGYEAEHRRFQELCMTTRRPLSAASPTAPGLLPRRPGKSPTSRPRVSRQPRDSET